MSGLDVKHFYCTEGPPWWTVKSDFKQKYSTSVGRGREGGEVGGVPCQGARVPHTKLITAAGAGGGEKLQTQSPPSLSTTPIISLTWAVWLLRRAKEEHKENSGQTGQGDEVTLSPSLSPWLIRNCDYCRPPPPARLRLKSRH